MSDTLSHQLEHIVGGEHVLRSPSAEYAVDGRMPRLVVFPADGEEVARIVRAIGEAGATVVPRGGGTKMTIGNIPHRAGVVLCLSRLNDIVEHDVDNLTVTVQAGLTLSELQKALALKGQFLPLDPPQAEKATVGGVVAANASGPKRLRYGSARDLVLGMGVVLADGQAIGMGGKTVKNVSGYDLDKLFIGSLGSLGLIVEVTLRLLPLPEETGTLLASFSRLSQATALAARILDSELLPVSMELLNGLAAGAASISTGDEYVLLFGLEGSPETVSRQVEQLATLCQEAEAAEVRSLAGEEEGALWEAVRDLLPAVLSPQAAAGKASLPISEVDSFVKDVQDMAAAHGLAAHVQARAGLGLVYVVLSGEGSSAVEKLVGACRQMGSLAVKPGGHWVLEAAPRPVKEQVEVWGPPRPEWALMQTLKARFDPQNVLNPGRFVGGI